MEAMESSAIKNYLRAIAEKETEMLSHLCMKRIRRGHFPKDEF